MKKITVNLSSYKYDIIIEDYLLNNLNNYIKQVYKNKEIYILTDENVAKLYLDKVTKNLEKDFTVRNVIIQAGEKSKNLYTYANICEKLLDLQIRRNHLIIALGGGVIGDLAGFVAATLYRGINYINIPTTLLSQMDSSIGGKTGIDFANRKNIIGSFKQPQLVLIDPKTLDTLPHDEYSNGMAELIKHAVIGNPELFQVLKTGMKANENIIEESLKVKSNLVQLDEFDQNVRMKLNFGHTFGHILELKENYKHGVAVGLGMLMAVRMGIDFGITDKNVLITLEQVMTKYGLPTTRFDYKKYLNEVVFDKKNLAGTVNFILVKQLGEAIIYPVKEEEIRK